MGKLEDLTALLVNELDDFKTSIEKMETINNQLHDTKVQIDVSEYKSIIKEHQQQMQSHLNEIKNFERRFNSKIEDAKIYPTWAVVVFILSVLVSGFFLVHIYYII
ncbi:DUF6730 family protein [Tamlana sp. 2201CG12-4]|uniref:primosomal replication protein PriC n=1 Tax=Tamlana sp. 2201CG12-4 TaxID=3112582 RepID=UPI002DBEB18A|nr:DUF6730 family protein [Tamlana sp. 2201CG12-4]MEC3908742.1 DUF6730 family protein [Tamlana sp. 2201CG12-4]